MKKLALVIFMIFTHSLWADSNQLHEGDQAIYHIKGKLMTVDYICPINGGPCNTELSIDFTLIGCMDRLGPVSYIVGPVVDDKLNIYVSAINIATELSTRVRCFAPEVVNHKINFLHKYVPRDNIIIHYL